MQYRPLGSTGIDVSVLSFGAGPVPNLMTSDDERQQQAVLARAIESGINWIDTAATYGAGQSERSLGQSLRGLAAHDRVHIATKARIMPEDVQDIPGAIRRSVEGSLKRLGVDSVTLLQLHNSVTAARGDEPTSLTTGDVLGPVLDEFLRLRNEGITQHIGITGLGQPEALRTVIRSGQFATMQVPFNLLNPSAGQSMEADFAETNYGNIMADCADMKMGVLAIRVFAGGALAGQPPSAHTYKTKFFPLDLYERDQSRTAELIREHGRADEVRSAAVRFAINHPHMSSAIVGFGAPKHVDEALEAIRVQRPV